MMNTLLSNIVDPSAVSTKQSGVTTNPPDGVSVVLIKRQIF
jgi:hypothetical protein